MPDELNSGLVQKCQDNSNLSGFNNENSSKLQPKYQSLDLKNDSIWIYMFFIEKYCYSATFNGFL